MYHHPRKTLYLTVFDEFMKAKEKSKKSRLLQSGGIDWAVNGTAADICEHDRGKKRLQYMMAWWPVVATQHAAIVFNF